MSDVRISDAADDDKRGRGMGVRKADRNARLVEALKTETKQAQIARDFGITSVRVYHLGWELCPDVMKKRKSKPPPKKAKR